MTTIIKSPSMSAELKASNKRLDKMLNKQRAWKAGKPVNLVVDAAGHKAPATSVWGLPPALQGEAGAN